MAPTATSDAAGPRRGRRGRRRALVAASGVEYARPERRGSARHPSDEVGGLAAVGLADEEGGLAAVGLADEEAGLVSVGLTGEEGGLVSVGLADEEDLRVMIAQDQFDAESEIHADPCAEVDEEQEHEGEAAEQQAEPVRILDRSNHRYGDRVEGWIRPEYRNPPDEPRPGEYWTPIPVDLGDDPEPSAKGYGWPMPVERLPTVPPYEPATGFDLAPVVAEPTEVVPAWPAAADRPGRIRLPRSWASRNEKPVGPEQPAGAEPAADGTAGDAAAPVVRRRPRPRPRPDMPVDRSTVYVSRHAADPSR